MKYKIVKTEILEITKNSLEQFEKQLSEVNDIIIEVKNGHYETSISEYIKDTNLGKSIVEMIDRLKEISKEDQNRNWANVGLAKFGDILRNVDALSLEALSDKILTNLIKYINANQGGIFILDDNKKNDEHLNLVACYAFDRKKHVNKRIEIGEGLVGQCLLEKLPTLISDIPDNYLSITSGLGHAMPRCIYIAPLLVNEKVYGVIELASFQQFEKFELDFINKLTENIASAVQNTKVNDHTRLLLLASQQQAEELRATEEEVRQNMEELQSTQEELARKSAELEKAKDAEANSILKGINATMATIEFTPLGQIENANDNFLKTIKYSLSEVKGQHHKMFVPQDIIDSQEYQSFWSRLAKGESINGVFRRMDSKMNTIWLSAIYTPIFNGDGSVKKVIKFATDITETQNLISENKSLIDGINVTMATIEFTPEGNILSANDNWLKTVNYTIEDIKGKHHKLFVDDETRNTTDYQSFWGRLSEGESISGVFKRIDADKKYIWLNAIYTPLKSADGKVKKVVKFANVVSKP